MDYKYNNKGKGQHFILSRKEYISIKGRGGLLFKNTQTQVSQLYRHYVAQGKARSSSLDEAKLVRTKLEVKALNKKIENEIKKLKNFRDCFLQAEENKACIKKPSPTNAINEIISVHQKSKEKHVESGTKKSPMDNTPAGEQRITSSPDHDSQKTYFRTMRSTSSPPAPELSCQKITALEDHSAIKPTHKKHNIERLKGGCIFGNNNNMPMPCTTYQTDYNPCDVVCRCPTHFQFSNRNNCNRYPNAPVPNPCYQYPMGPYYQQQQLPDYGMSGCTCPQPSFARKKTDLNTEDFCCNRSPVKEPLFNLYNSKVDSKFPSTSAFTRRTVDKEKSKRTGLTKTRNKYPSPSHTPRYQENDKTEMKTLLKMQQLEKPDRTRDSKFRQPSDKKMIVKAYVPVKKKIVVGKFAEMEKSQLAREYVDHYKEVNNKDSSENTSELPTNATYTKIPINTENKQRSTESVLSPSYDFPVTSAAVPQEATSTDVKYDPKEILLEQSRSLQEATPAGGSGHMQQSSLQLSVKQNLQGVNSAEGSRSLHESSLQLSVKQSGSHQDSHGANSAEATNIQSQSSLLLSIKESRSFPDSQGATPAELTYHQDVLLQQSRSLQAPQEAPPAGGSRHMQQSSLQLSVKQNLQAANSAEGSRSLHESSLQLSVKQSDSHQDSHGAISADESSLLLSVKQSLSLQDYQGASSAEISHQELLLQKSRFLLTPQEDSTAGGSRHLPETSLQLTAQQSRSREAAAISLEKSNQNLRGQQGIVENLSKDLTKDHRNHTERQHVVRMQDTMQKCTRSTKHSEVRDSMSICQTKEFKEECFKYSSSVAVPDNKESQFDRPSQPAAFKTFPIKTGSPEFVHFGYQSQNRSPSASLRQHPNYSDKTSSQIYRTPDQSSFRSQCVNPQLQFQLSMNLNQTSPRRSLSPDQTASAYRSLEQTQGTSPLRYPRREQYISCQSSQMTADRTMGNQQISVNNVMTDPCRHLGQTSGTYEVRMQHYLRPRSEEQMPEDGRQESSQQTSSPISSPRTHLGSVLDNYPANNSGNLKFSPLSSPRSYAESYSDSYLASNSGNSRSSPKSSLRSPPGSYQGSHSETCLDSFPESSPRMYVPLQKSCIKQCSAPMESDRTDYQSFPEYAQFDNDYGTAQQVGLTAYQSSPIEYESDTSLKSSEQGSVFTVYDDSSTSRSHKDQSFRQQQQEQQRQQSYQNYQFQQELQMREKQITTICAKRTRCVTFQDEKKISETSTSIKCSRSVIDWAQAHEPGEDLSSVESDESADDFMDTCRMRTSGSEAEYTCFDESNCEDGYATCNECKPQAQRSRLPEFDGCPCMYLNYLALAALADR